MRVQYLNMYKWDNFADGTKEKFNGRLDSLIFELSLLTKLGCADITIPVYLPKEMYNKEMEIKYKIAKKNYKLRGEKLTSLIYLIKTTVLHNKIINGEYLYELWINKIFELNWREKTDMNDPIHDLDILYKNLLSNKDVNPYDIDLNPKKENIKGLKKILNNIFK